MRRYNGGWRYSLWKARKKEKPPFHYFFPLFPAFAFLLVLRFSFYGKQTIMGATTSDREIWNQGSGIWFIFFNRQFCWKPDYFTYIFNDKKQTACGRVLSHTIISHLATEHIACIFSETQSPCFWACLPTHNCIQIRGPHCCPGNDLTSCNSSPRR